MLHTDVNGKTVVLGSPQGVINRTLLKGKAFETDQAPDGSQFVDLNDIGYSLNKLGEHVTAQFVGMDEFTMAVLSALASGEHFFVYGPPGNAKTKAIEALVTGIGGTFAERQITAESTMDDIFGPVDAVEFSNGVYTRRWAGIATSDVFYINEVWEANSTVTNIFKTALESRVVHDGDVIRPIPLLSAIADSNHVPTEKNQQADWDRFLVRMALGYLRDKDEFRQMLTADAGSKHIPELVTPDQIRLLSAASESLAFDPGSDLQDGLVGLWEQLGQNGSIISNRRWRKTLKLACAQALMNGEAPEAHHLSVGRWTLWNELDERKDITDTVLSMTDPVAGDVLDIEALLGDLKQARDQMAGDAAAKSDMVQRQDLIAKGRKLWKDAQDLLDDPSSNGYSDRIQSVIDESNTIWNEVLDW